MVKHVRKASRPTGPDDSIRVIEDRMLERRLLPVPKVTLTGDERLSQTDINRRIEIYYRANRHNIAQGAEARWGKNADVDNCKRAYQILMDGGDSKRIASELSVNPTRAKALRRVVLDDVQQQSSRDAQEILKLLEGRAVTEQERQVFELIGVQGMTENEARKILDLSEARVSQIKTEIVGKFPGLKSVLGQKRVSKGVREKRAMDAKRRQAAEESMKAALTTFLREKDTRKLTGTIVNISMCGCGTSEQAVEKAGKLLDVIDSAEEQMEKRKFPHVFPERYKKASLSAIINYAGFSGDVGKAVKDLATIATTVNKNVDRSQRNVFFSQVARPTYADNPDAVMGRIQEIKDTRKMIMDELKKINAPGECWGKIEGNLMVITDPQKRRDEILQRARDLAQTYVDLKEIIVTEGHPVAVAENVGVPAITCRNPLEGWRRELNNHLKKEKAEVGERGYIESTQLTDEEITRLIDEARDGGTGAVETLTQRFESIVKDQSETGKDERENRELTEHIIMELPERYFEKHPLIDLITYVSYALKVNGIRRHRMQARSRIARIE